MIPAADHDPTSGKRKPNPKLQRDSESRKRSRTADVQPGSSTLIAPHRTILAELDSKYNVLAASVISSTKICKRVTNTANHLLGGGDRPTLVLLHARTADVCKLVTVVETCKKVLGEEGKAWYQYNQLFDLPDKPKRRDVIEETMLEKDAQDDDSDSDDFEVMHSRFEEAVLPRPSTRSVKSMRVFLSMVPIPELRSRKGTTAQFSGEKKA
ncbi:hypothetical protein ACJ41O_005066 [Fusarium nematophilum]